MSNDSGTNRVKDPMFATEEELQKEREALKLLFTKLDQVLSGKKPRRNIIKDPFCREHGHDWQGPYYGPRGGAFWKCADCTIVSYRPRKEKKPEFRVGQKQCHECGKVLSSQELFARRCEACGWYWRGDYAERVAT